MAYKRKKWIWFFRQIKYIIGEKEKMRDTKPFISIIVPVKNEENNLVNFFESLRQLAYPRNRFEIIITDGASIDNSRQIALKYGARVFDNPKQTVAPGRNIGFTHAKGKIIAFTDADCVVDQNWLKNSVKYFADPKVAGVGGPNFTPSDESNFAKAVGFFMSQSLFSAGSVQGLNLPYIKPVESLPGCNSIYSKSILDTVMPIDETLLTCDDTDMNLKIKDLGYILLSVPDVYVWHHQRSTPLKLWHKMYRWAIGRLQLGKKRKKDINLIHCLTGFSLPLLVITAIFLSIINPFLLVSLIFFVFFALFFFTYLRTKSIQVSINLPFVFIIVIFAWSAGFLKELSSPLQNPSGH